MSYGEIAEINGVQVRTVEYIIRNFASELPETPVMRKKKKDVSAEDYDALPCGNHPSEEGVAP